MPTARRAENVASPADHRPRALQNASPPAPDPEDAVALVGMGCQVEGWAPPTRRWIKTYSAAPLSDGGRSLPS